MLRAGPFSDERVVGLLNARFVPFYFDLGPGSPAADDDARAFVVERKPELGSSSVPTPPVLAVTPAGEILGELSNYASEAEMRAFLLDLLRGHPEWARPAEAEAEAPVLERAGLAALLGDPQAGLDLLAEEDGDPARLAAARIARWKGDWERHASELARVSAGSANEVRVERALRAWNDERFDALEELLADYPADAPRADEARYHLGLARYHRGAVEDAKAVWKALVADVGESPWAYRADWAYTQAGEEPGGRRVFTTNGPGTLLGRHGYMGRRNPDLAGPGR